ncbi:D-isomer specific 2-hydroxyacid dehydrogenase [Macrophomina phaseolina]|uniref:D-isomer specific 2-hydroxyacid dehydrogenase n=1 Tax=Macrophomina phaseolina TaxID=35725 RepID=A0ABQ8FU61_9PEZI|nr:D-isomer specific 2-hydroxyacid dehydrogenase [Macrophomina phaseolina]
MALAAVSAANSVPSPLNPPLNPKPTVYVIDKFHPDAIEYARTIFNVILQDEVISDSEAGCKAATGILIRGSPLSAADLAAYPNLRAIGKHGVGTDKIDTDACKERGIAVLNTPGANARAVAELVLALGMDVARQMSDIHRRQCNGDVVAKDTCRGLTLFRKKIGVVGMGHIGREVARIFYGAFEAEILAYDHNPSPEKALAWANVPHQFVADLDDVVAAADVLTLHIPLNPETRDLFNYPRLCKMNQEAILINTARGGVVNEKDLERVLREGRLWGVGLDCHDEEPPTRARYGSIWDLPNVVSTPHIGAMTAEARLAASMAAVNNLHRYFVR